MLDGFSLLPLLSGWEYKSVGLPARTVVRGATPIEVYRAEEDGWVYDVSLASTDAYASIIVAYQGADLETRIVRANPEAFRTLGLWQASPGGWLNRYYRPVAASTAGIYVATLGHYLYGWTAPFIRTIIVQYELLTSSTQESCEMSASASKITITDKERFILSLRNILGIKEKYIDWDLIPLGKTK